MARDTDVHFPHGAAKNRSPVRRRLSRSTPRRALLTISLSMGVALMSLPVWAAQAQPTRPREALAFAGNPSPLVSITDPSTAGQRFSLPHTALVTASDNSAVRTVEVKVDGASYSAATCSGLNTPNASCRFELTGLAIGSHTLFAKASDGNSRTVAGRGFEVTISTPTPTGSTYTPVFTNPQGYYMTKLDSSGPAPVDPGSSAWINDMLRRVTLNGVHIYFAHDTAVAKTTDKACSTNGYSYHVPAGFNTDSGGRGGIIDPATNWALGTVNGMSNGCLASVEDAYHVNSNGLAANVATGTAGNTGHRGAGSARKSVLRDELWQNGAPTSSVGMRMQCSAPIVTDVHGQPFSWPLSGGDAGGRTTEPVPEGAVIRIKRSVDVAAVKTSPEVKAVLHGLQDYGCLVVDGGSA
ncbi:MAG: Ig-like domain-containing protein, partial [Actinobacteria bacterium]|nr:Ig-like domain-containing protein [Actinomycetota bacterium]